MFFVWMTQFPIADRIRIQEPCFMQPFSRLFLVSWTCSLSTRKLTDFLDAHFLIHLQGPYVGMHPKTISMLLFFPHPCFRTCLPRHSPLLSSWSSARGRLFRAQLLHIPPPPLPLAQLLRTWASPFAPFINDFEYSYETFPLRFFVVPSLSPDHA